MRQSLKAVAAGVLLTAGATFALAQTNTQTTPSDSPSKAEPGAPQQGPGTQVPGSSMGTGTRPIGPPATDDIAPGKNPTGQSTEKQRSEGDDPRSGGVPPQK